MGVGKEAVTLGSTCKVQLMMTRREDVKKAKAKKHTNICMMEEDLVGVFDSCWGNKRRIMVYSFSFSFLESDWIGLID